MKTSDELLALVMDENLSYPRRAYYVDLLGSVKCTPEIEKCLCALANHASPLIREGVVRALDKLTELEKFAFVTLQQMKIKETSPAVRMVIEDALATGEWFED